MNVSLIDYTGRGCPNPGLEAMNVLIFAKSTRLNMTPGLLKEIENKSVTEKLEEIKYIANTIPSSWEFVHYTFMIENVTRAFTHQFVRTRTASFAQQTMRILDMEKWTYGTGPSINDEKKKNTFETVMTVIDAGYRQLIKDGVKIEDARGILPTNIHTNILMSCNLRTFVEMVRKRTSPRVQGEYRQVIEAMVKTVTAVHPWITHFTERTFDQAAKDLDKEILAIEDETKRNRMVKLVDQMRQNG